MKSRVPMTWGKGRDRIHLPYLLIESDDPALAVSDFTAFLEAGFNPAFCAGPGPGQPCPLLEGGRCDLVDQADVVLHRMHQNSGIARAIRHSRPELPVVVVAPGPGGDLTPTASVDAQADALRREVYRGKTWTPSVGACRRTKP
jgi:hypothetical protein